MATWAGGVVTVRFRKIGVVGTTATALGVTQVAASRNLEVVVIDLRGKRLENFEYQLEMALQQRLDKWDITEAEMRATLSRVAVTKDYGALEDVDFVLECAIENLQEKQKIFRRIDEVCGDDVVIGSNTSTLSVTEIASAIERPEYVIGTHFLPPVTRADVVELVRGLHTADKTMQQTRSFMQQLGKTGIEVYESPGYVTTRLILPLINEAIHAFIEGVANVEEIDLAMRLGFGLRHGPLEIVDRMGMDTALVLMERMWRETGENQYRPTALMKKLVRAGHLGTRVGRGFYTYDEQGNRLKPAVQGSPGGTVL